MLVPFWYRTEVGLGYGVTAFSREDADSLLRELGYPYDYEVVVEVVANVKHADLEQNHLVPNSGPIVVRGVWFPFHNI